jgi:hypothetical protein
MKLCSLLWAIFVLNVWTPCLKFPIIPQNFPEFSHTYLIKSLFIAFLFRHHIFPKLILNFPAPHFLSSIRFELMPLCNSLFLSSFWVDDILYKLQHLRYARQALLLQSRSRFRQCSGSSIT